MAFTGTAIYFASAKEFRKWLSLHHASAAELWVGYHRKHTGRPSMTWPESVDEALCFGWIDGIRKSVDEDRYVIRFTPRRKGSNWSAVNLRRVKSLMRAKRMQPAGLEVYEARDRRKAGYAYELRQPMSLDAESERRFRANAVAWKFFDAQPPGYRKLALKYVMSAKRETTRERRLNQLIADSAAGRRLGPRPSGE